MEIYDISIAPGQVRDIFCNGGYVYFYSGSAGGGDSTITVNQDSRGQRVLLQPGQAYRMPNGETGTRWLIGNLRGEGTIVGRLVIGSGELTDNRITGSVEVIDGGFFRTLANKAFAWTSGAPAAVGTYARCQIYNPAGSEKYAAIKKVSLSPAGACVVAVFTHSQRLSNFDAIENSKNPGGANSAMQEANENGAATMTNRKWLEYMQFAAAGTEKVCFQEPVVIKPGWGIVIECQSLNMQVNGAFEWTEERL